ncbi:hypothetical protein [Streptomyces azureus]|nr:hypothetical protein [Streptomyces azureus]
MTLAEGGSCLFALHEEVPVAPAGHPGHVPDRDDGRFAACGPATHFGDRHVRTTQQVPGWSRITADWARFTDSRRTDLRRSA